MTGREQLQAWEKDIRRNSYLSDDDFRHSVSYHLPGKNLDQELTDFARVVIEEVEPLVAENSRPENLPRIAAYDGIGNPIEQIVHHPTYVEIGNRIYGSGMIEKMAKKGSLVEGLMFFFLSSQAGEAGHNCPIACSYGLIRVLQKFPDIPQSAFYLQKLIAPSFDENFTGAQFVTEVQGGSDAGSNTTRAVHENGSWKISGEKWFCSNANANLILMTARFDPSVEGTKGLGLFLVPALLEDGRRNHFTFRRLKDKLGTKTLATAEIDFNGALAFPVGKPEEGFKILMENVLHASRLFNTITVLGMARRAFHIALSYAKHREAFGRPLIDYPLIRESLNRIQAENTALLASLLATARLQDACDLKESEEQKLLLRLLANLNKTLSSKRAVEHIHQCLDVLAGNGTIESFSPIPLLLRDSLICENWEGTHNVLCLQILKDIQRYQIDELFFRHVEPLIARAESLNLRALLNNWLECRQTLKAASPEQQTLLIKNFVQLTGDLFSAVHLFFEAIDQESKGSTSKLHCLKEFLKRP